MSDRNEKRCGKECGFALKAQRKIVKWKMGKMRNKVGVSGGYAQVGGRTFWRSGSEGWDASESTEVVR